MSRETKLLSIILKKQPFKEGDEIITLFSKEQGKVRALAKSVKSSKSKLQQKLQALFLVEVILTQGKMPKIISAETVKVFYKMRENLKAMKIAFYTTELALKITADEQKNEKLFYLLEEFLSFLDSQDDEVVLNLGLAKFKIEMLEVSGLGVQEDLGPLFKALKQINFKQIAEMKRHPGLEDLQNLLSQFIEYQLERKLKSENYLRQ